MATENFGEKENGEYALTEVRQPLQSRQGGRGRCGVAMGKMEAVVVRHSAREVTAVLRELRRLLRCCERRRRKQERQMRALGSHGRTLRLQLMRSGPTWPEQAGCQRHAAPHGAETLLLVGSL